jgi:hypothetical protein
MSRRGPFPSSRRSIIYDRVDPEDFRKYKNTFSCEDCSHFNRGNESCTLGFDSSLHRREEQLRTFTLSGHIALCRFLEID